jgi:hypothetical protein
VDERFDIIPVTALNHCGEFGESIAHGCYVLICSLNLSELGGTIGWSLCLGAITTAHDEYGNKDEEEGD